jgi:hypothetical protein
MYEVLCQVIYIKPLYYVDFLWRHPACRCHLLAPSLPLLWSRWFTSRVLCKHPLPVKKTPKNPWEKKLTDFFDQGVPTQTRRVGGCEAVGLSHTLIHKKSNLPSGWYCCLCKCFYICVPPCVFHYIGYRTRDASHKHCAPASGLLVTGKWALLQYLTDES